LLIHVGFCRIDLICGEFIRVSTEFFNEIYVTPELMHPYSIYLPEYKMWKWCGPELEEAKESEKIQDMEKEWERLRKNPQELNVDQGYFMEVGEKVRMKIEAVKFRTAVIDINATEGTNGADDADRHMDFENGEETDLGNVPRIPSVLPAARPRSSSVSSAVMTTQEDKVTLPGSRTKGPMIVFARCDEPGLGSIAWWDSEEGEEPLEEEN